VDTSALLKIYVEEEGSALVRERFSQAAELATSAITFVEAHSALARRRNAGGLSPEDYRKAVREFSEGWEQYLRLEIGDEVLGEAARLAREHVLRAYDAIHLGSAVVFRSRVRADVAVASWDDELDAAARREGFSLLRHPRPRD
jgi:predicted nucleic acid-binding protein